MTPLVVGAGLAGLAAALDLAKAGLRPVVAERRAFPGGRAYSFTDPSGAELDNGQHVIMGCCTEYRRFLDDIGAADLVEIQPRTDVTIVDARTGDTSRLRESWLPAPLHFLPSILTYTPLPGRDRRGLVGAARAMKRDAGSDHESFGDWLKRQGQSDAAVRLFWEPLIVSVLNERVGEVSSEQAIYVFREGFFAGREASRIGIARVPLGEIARRAVEKIRALGGAVEFNRRIESLPEGPVICAIPARALGELMGGHPYFARTAAMKTSPILNLHAMYERPVEGPRFFAVVGGLLQWVFLHGSRVTISQSAARDLIELPNAEVESRLLGELERVLPSVRGIKPARTAIVREREATFVARPGGKDDRLPCVTPVPNLFLAGEWTEGEWPSTMEAAVRSGRRAARAMMESRDKTVGASVQQER